MNGESALEAHLVSLGLTAERVKPLSIDSQIESVEWHVFPGSLLTVCAITLKNKFLVIGESACANPLNFNEQVGKDVSFLNAREKIWMLEGYLLKEKLFGTRVSKEQ